MDSNASVSLLCIALLILSFLPLFRREKVFSIGLVAVYVLTIIPVSWLGYSVTTPFLVLGSVVFAMTLFVDYIFERARELDVNSRTA